MIKRNSIVTKEDFSDNIDRLRTTSSDTSVNILDLIDTSNSLYMKSSVFEDCILEKYLSLYNMIKNVEFNKKLNYIFTESFISEEYFDKDFDVDNKLNIDILNGDATLPIKDTEDIKVSSIIIENNSNGNIGSSIGDQKYNNINNILSSDSSTLFIYEKIVSILSINKLKFNITLKFDKEEICNSLYVKLYVDSDTKYPKISSMKTSLDGISYDDVEISYIDSNKSDRYIRFQPKLMRYISLSFEQDTYDSIQTNFGNRYRYSIGIREISPKRTEYSDSGEYVSVPISIPKNTNSINFTVNDISNNDIKYLLSANNGARWIELSKNAANVLYNDKLGLDVLDEILNVRIKVLMDKEDIKFDIKENVEYMVSSIANKYYLKQIPLTVEGFIGNHISYGNKTPYITNIESLPVSGFINITLNYVPYNTTKIDNIDILSKIIIDDPNKILVVENNGVEIDPTYYSIIQDAYSENSILNIDSTVISTGNLCIYYKPLIYKGSEGNTIPLIQNLFVNNDTNAIFVASIDSQSNISILGNDQFIVVDKKTIQIKDSSYNNNNNYMILYSPESKISDTIYIDNNEITIPSMKNILTSQIRFNYTYESDEDTSIIKYYTPISHEYKVEFI